MNEIAKKIVKKLIEIHGSDTFKIAFLPYKRSMWNSMSSVYDECINAGIDAHVYPIPYFRHDTKSTDTDYDLFEMAEDIETLKDPDFIAIHYHFDDQNLVTSMLPEYYTKAIKERYKCKIIFLPYGIKYDVGNEYYLYSGYIGIDYIFTSEINEDFVEEWKKQGVDFTGRIFPYGTTKLDVSSAMKGRRVIPDEWKDIIGDKSVTLILNSLTSFINEPYRKTLDYLCYTIQELSKWHIVIFRPHPLMRQTIKTMVPESEPYWDFLIKELSALGVIVDESEYLERAMLAADYLISDPSSVVIMWEATGKPYTKIRG